MISRNRSAPTAAAMSIDRTTSANKTVTCLYSARLSAAVIGVPQASQNRAPSLSPAPHAPHDVATAKQDMGRRLIAGELGQDGPQCLEVGLVESRQDLRSRVVCRIDRLHHVAARV